jgi:hypothetical protein
MKTRILQQNDAAYNNTETHTGTKAYRKISSVQVTDILRRHSYEKVATSANSGSDTGKHVTVYRKIDFGSFGQEEIPQIVVTNSHNCSCSFKMQLGVFRIVCANGLVSGNDLVEPLKIRHVGEWTEEELETKIAAFLTGTEVIEREIDRLKKRELTNFELVSLAYKTLGLRKTTTLKTPLEELLRPLREEDKGQTAWTVLNLLQEKAVRGTKGIRELKSLKSQSEVSRKIWEEVVALAA